MNLAGLMQRAGRAFGERPALAVGTEPRANYRELAERVARLAGGLRAGLGLRPGDRIAIVMRNCPEFVEVMYAAWHAGLVAVPVNARLHAREFAFILEHCGARACFATADLVEALAPLPAELPGLERLIAADSPEYAALVRQEPAALAEPASDDTAWLFYTSGTTGRPKGAMLSHRNLMAMTLGYFADVDAVSSGDCILHAAPMSHGSGLYNIPHVAKAACQVVPASGQFDPAEVLDLCEAWRGVGMFLAPTMVKRLVEEAERRGQTAPGLKTIVYGGGPMYREDIRRALAVLGDRFVQIYGQGESPMTITALSKALHADRAHPRYEARLASVGLPHTGAEVRIVGEDGRDLPPDAIGEVLVRGDAVMGGYWEDPAATAAALRGGWLHTGDLGGLDEDGFLTLWDRSKDLIISGGANIYPREVEEVLLRHEAVVEAAVIGRPHPVWGEEVVAFVVPRPGAAVAEEALEALCLAHIARFKRPRLYRFVEALPKNNYGKVLKTVLRNQVASEAGEG